MALRTCLGQGARSASLHGLHERQYAVAFGVGHLGLLVVQGFYVTPNCGFMHWGVAIEALVGNKIGIVLSHPFNGNV